MSKVVISITGHRLLTPEQKAKVKPVVKKAIENIMFTVKEHDTASFFTGLSPLAEGADTLFAEVIREMGLPLKVMLPFEREEYMKDFSSDQVRHEFDALYDRIDKADKRVTGSVKNAPVDQLYLEMGIKLVDETEFLIALWNEKAGNGKGGTADIVEYALEKKKNILLINPESTHPHINYLHKDHHSRWESQEVIDTSQTNHLAQFIAHKQKEFDANAVLHNKKYKRIWTTGFLLGLLEVMAFAVLISFHVSLELHFVLASIEFLCILTIILLVLFGNAKKLHSSYVHYRIISERLRIKKFFAELGLRIYHTSVSPIYFSFKEKPEYSILDNTIRLTNLSAYSYLSFVEKKRRLESELIIDQYEYHEHKKEKYEKKNELYKNVRQVLFLVFACAVTLHFAHVTNDFFLHHGVRLTTWEFPLFHVHLFEEIIVLLSIFIPATIAASEALKYLYEWEKIITLSSAMANYFKERAKKLEHVHTEAELEVFINGINKDMLIENLDWEKYMHDKNEVPT